MWCRTCCAEWDDVKMRKTMSSITDRQLLMCLSSSNIWTELIWNQLVAGWSSALHHLPPWLTDWLTDCCENNHLKHVMKNVSTHLKFLFRLLANGEASELICSVYLSHSWKILTNDLSIDQEHTFFLHDSHSLIRKTTSVLNINVPH